MRSNAQDPSPTFIGMEGGATRTVAVETDDQERVLGRLEAGPANLKLMRESELAEQFKEFAERFSTPAAVGIGIAGLRTDADRAQVLRAASAAWPGILCYVSADLETAIAAAPAPQAPVEARVLILSGTGSCCFGGNARGETAKVGGWGHWLGDKGSGYEIGLRALKACVHRYDVDGIWPKLGSTLLRVLQLNEPDDLVAWIQGAEKWEIAALALEVFSSWKRRDKIASDVLSGAAASLGKDAAACASRLAARGRRVQFVFAGSVLLKQQSFARLVANHVSKLWPGAEVAFVKREGALGAVRLARAHWLKGGGAHRGASLAGEQFRASRRLPIPIPVALGLSPTEQRHPESARLDRMSIRDAIDLMLRQEARVAGVLAGKRREIAACIRLIVTAFKSGGRLFYVGAGTSGRLGALDASECPPTFRASPDQVQGIIAGGQQALWQSIEGAEDDAPAGARAVRFRGVTRRDVLVGIAASGRTPFVWGALHEARKRGARTVLVCFNPNLRIAREHRPNVVIAADLGPEVLTGSTRLKAGTATKLLLNIFSTLAMVQLGKVASNLMVDLNPSNVKLRERAVRIVRELTELSEEQAKEELEAEGWVIKKVLAKRGRK